MSFSFGNIGSWLDGAVDFVLGEKEYESGDVVGRSGGFLDLAKSGAKAYSAMSESDEDKEAFQATKFERPQLQRFRGRAPDARLSNIANPVGLQNARIETAIRKFMNRQSSNSHMSRMQQDISVARNIRQGRKTTGLEAPKIPAVAGMKIAPVRKESV